MKTTLLPWVVMVEGGIFRYTLVNKGGEGMKRENYMYLPRVTFGIC